MKICIVSPHLDDALLSCGILIQKLSATNQIYILNVFSKGELSIDRKKEDQEAFKNLNVELFYLDEPEAPSRNPKFKSIEELVFGDFDKIDLQYKERIKNIIKNFCLENEINAVYFPLAAGCHVDHRLVFQACLGLNIDKYLYEERPYVIWDGIIEARIREFSQNYEIISEKKMAEKINSYFFLKYFVPEGNIRNNCLEKYLNLLRSNNKEKVKLQSYKLIYADEAEVINLYEALKKYTSQMLNIFPSFEIFLNENLEYSQRVLNSIKYTERFWKI